MFNQFTSYITGTTSSDTSNTDTREAKVIPLVTDENDTVQHHDLFNLVKGCVVGINNKNHHKTKLLAIGVNDKVETIKNGVKIGLYNTTCVLKEQSGGQSGDDVEIYERTEKFKSIVINDVVYNWNNRDRSTTGDRFLDKIKDNYFRAGVAMGDDCLEVTREDNKVALSWDISSANLTISYSRFEFSSESEAREVYEMLLKFINPQPEITSFNANL
jgi:hypothetical protein